MSAQFQQNRAPLTLRAGAGFAAGAILNLTIGAAGAQLLFAHGFAQGWYAMLGAAAGAIEGAVGGLALDGAGAALAFGFAFALVPMLYSALAGFIFACGAAVAPHHPEAAEFVRGAAGGALTLGTVGALAAALISRGLRSTSDGFWTFGLGGALRGAIASSLVRSIMRGATALGGLGATIVGIGGPALATFVAGALFARNYPQRK